MQWYYKLSIKYKVYLIALVAFLGFSGYFFSTLIMSSKQNSTIERIQNRSFPLLQYGERSIVRFERIQEMLAGAVSSDELDLLENTNKQKEAMLEDLSKAKELAPESLAPQIITAFTEYYGTSYGISKSMLDGSADFSKMAELTNLMTNQLKETKELLEKFNDENRLGVDELISKAEQISEDMFVLGVNIGAVTFILITCISIWISRSIKGAIDEVVGSLKNIAQENGDLTVQLNSRSQDEIGQLVYWFNEFIAKLRDVISKMVVSAGPLQELSGQLNALMNKVNENLEYQRQSTQSSKDAVDQMQESMKSIVNDASAAAESANDAKKESEQGRQVVDCTMSSIRMLSDGVSDAATVIRQLEEDTDEVREVLDAIKGIAAQTNLLALNAAIEAARAGEQGRGFAVVADEVRSLASKTQESTEIIGVTIGKLISASQNAVTVMDSGTAQAQSGVENSEKAQQSLNRITNSISVITDMNNSISEAVNNQQDVSLDIVKSVADIAEQSNDTANEANRLGELAIELNKVSTEMNYITSQFKI